MNELDPMISEEERLVREQIELLVRHTVLVRPLDMDFIQVHAEMLLEFADLARNRRETRRQDVS